METKIYCEKCKTLMIHKDNVYIMVRAIWDYCPKCRHEQNREVINLNISNKNTKELEKEGVL